MRRRAYLYFVLLAAIICVASLCTPVHAVDFSLVIETDKSSYSIGESVNIAGNLTLDGSPVADELVALQVNVSNSAIIYRTFNTGSNPTDPLEIYVNGTFISNGVGNPVTNAYRDGITLYFICVQFNNSQPYPIEALITFTVFDSGNNAIYVRTRDPAPVFFEGNSTYSWLAPFMIPEDAELGTAKIYANAFTDYPEKKGWSHCPEQSYTFNIVSPGGMSYSSQASGASQEAGTFSTTFHIKRYGGRLGNYTISASSFRLVNLTPFIAFDSVTFQVILQGDLNHDNYVDIFDIVIVATQFSRPPPPITDSRADVNGDGNVDIFDLVSVAVHYGEWGIP